MLGVLVDISVTGANVNIVKCLLFSLNFPRRNVFFMVSFDVTTYCVYGGLQRKISRYKPVSNSITVKY